MKSVKAGSTVQSAAFIYNHDTNEKEEREVEEQDDSDKLRLELEEAHRLNEWLNACLEEALYEARFDTLTGLKNRRELYKKATALIRDIFQVPKDKKPTDSGWLDYIEQDERDFSDLDLYFMMSDVSFLSFANKLNGGHNNGDILLIRISERMRSIIGDCCRHGGDEITACLQESRESLTEKASRVILSVNNIDDLAGLTKYQIKPNIDIGFASFAEGIELFRKLLAEESTRYQLDKDVLRKLQDTWLAIADKKAFRNKAQKRLAFLLDRRAQDIEIDSSLIKAAYDVSGEELDALNIQIEDTENGLDKLVIIDLFIRQKELDGLEKLEDHERIAEKLILEQIGII